MLNNSYYSYFFVEKIPTFSYFSVKKSPTFFLLFGEWLLEGLHVAANSIGSYSVQNKPNTTCIFLRSEYNTTAGPHCVYDIVVTGAELPGAGRPADERSADGHGPQGADTGGEEPTLRGEPTAPQETTGSSLHTCIICSCLSSFKLFFLKR